MTQLLRLKFWLIPDVVAQYARTGVVINSSGSTLTIIIIVFILRLTLGFYKAIKHKVA